jgi:probable rRNA maturation factor
MIELNQRWLNHDGPTDVITFDHGKEDPALELYGEIFLCPQQAIFQARQFRVAWTVELTRHLVHGVLHLQGFDDLKAQARVRMKRRENRLIHNLCQVIDLNRISGESCPLS